MNEKRKKNGKMIMRIMRSIIELEYFFFFVLFQMKFLFFNRVYIITQSRI